MTKTGFHHIHESFGTLKQFKIAKNRIFKGFFYQFQKLHTYSKTTFRNIFPHRLKK